MLSLARLNLLVDLVKYLSFTLSFTTPVSTFVLATDHTGSTTSTGFPVPVPPGSFLPIVIVVAGLLWPDVSVIVPSGNPNVKIPL